MKRAILILVLGLATAVVAYSAVYLKTTQREREALNADAPELLWLKQEFGLDEAQFGKIVKLHDAYLPQCSVTCQKIATKNAELRANFAKTDSVTPVIEEELNDIAKLRAQCQADMLRHFYDVSRAMPPAAGRRYLAWIQEKTVLCGPGQMNMDMGNPGHRMQ